MPNVNVRKVKDNDWAISPVLCSESEIRPTINVIIDKFLLETEPICYISNDGIGSYEYWGQACFDHGTDYLECDGADPSDQKFTITVGRKFPVDEFVGEFLHACYNEQVNLRSPDGEMTSDNGYIFVHLSVEYSNDDCPMRVERIVVELSYAVK